MRKLKTYNFSLLISKPTVDEETAADRLYAGGCDDAIFGVSNCVYEVEFDREAKSLQQALKTALRDVRGANIGVSILKMVVNLS